MKKLLLLLVSIGVIATIPSPSASWDLMYRVECVNWKHARMRTAAMLCTQDPTCVPSSQGSINEAYDACVARCN